MDLNLEKETIKLDDNFELKEESDEASEAAPVITHTLVDLYCAQGHTQKAKEILEKILELNPTDEKTKVKLNEVNELLLLNNEEFPVEIKIEEKIEEKEYSKLKNKISKDELHFCFCFEE